MQKLVGILVVFICVFGGFVMANGQLMALWQPAEIVIIVGAGLGALIMGNSMAVLKGIWLQLKAVSKGNKEDAELYRQLLPLLHQLLEETRAKGLKALDGHVESPKDSPLFGRHPLVAGNPVLLGFIIDNLRMLGMGKLNAHELEGLLEQEIEALEESMLKPSQALAKTADAMPGFGILAAVMGIIITMQHLDGPLTYIGLHVAAALVGTFLGIFACYCLLSPMSNAMEQWVGRRITALECVRAVLVSHVGGKSPLLAVDAGRKLIEQDIKPSFIEMESWVAEREAS
ncbi:flagellar motor stator protein MotA [Zobellella iuensis]|uniref:Flagellar motor stator protein MotA n=1 Tax=Zobellella iuensis TaxID=2803811 RepID=A0ABS1QX86_9GAMM|nr:flagellar motor stator protein MotA [Zobellella iuensis]MBL1378839.1 flagellar motor stator protein MotA [Zobellella iuensis]